ncbi:MAG: hypothetical protein CM15mP60_1580 [Alphaproteobacteria bacterium]|nr:MAG: hypothetical protein CM15mP60_1580 [Alphaproteobacteria bacterium]
MCAPSVKGAVEIKPRNPILGLIFFRPDPGPREAFPSPHFKVSTGPRRKMKTTPVNPSHGKFPSNELSRGSFENVMRYQTTLIFPKTRFGLRRQYEANNGWYRKHFFDVAGPSMSAQWSFQHHARNPWNAGF